MIQSLRGRWFAGCVVLYAAVRVIPAQQTADKVDFVRDVQPVFERTCYSCHGPKVQMGGLRLDSKQSAFAGGLSGKAIQPGSAAASLIYKRVIGTGEQARMPMGADPLEPARIATIRQWIDQGAEWPESAAGAAAEIRKHWAFVAPKRPVPPSVTVSKWPANPIDNFVLQRLEKEGLQPSPEADRVTLLRRLSLDLTGLPPAIEEVDAFVADKSANAYQKQVDRLLASPHYGERWGRHWLDAARYADSDGFEKDKQRNVWFYRDWVIQAINRDLPYDRFIIEQIAGDLLPNPTQDQIVATGFLRNSMINEEGGIDPEQFRMEAMFDRMDAIGKGVLGITIQCAQCHNHKYDPLTQEDYYRVFAFLNSTHEANVAVYTPEQQRKRGDIYRRIREIEQDLKHRTPDWQERMAKWESETMRAQPDWTIVKPEPEDISTGGQRYLPMPDSSLLAQGYAPTKHKVKLVVKTAMPKVGAFRLELLNDPNLPLGGPGRSIKGTGALTEFEVEAAPADGSAKPQPVKIAKAWADISLPETPLDPIFDDKSGRKRVTGPIDFAIDAKDDTAWGFDAGPVLRNRPRQAVFEATEPIGYPGGSVFNIYLNQRHGGWNSDDNQNYNLGRMRLAIATGAANAPVPAAISEILSIPAEKRSAAQTDAIFSHWRTTVAEWKDANQTIAALWREHPEGSSQLVMQARRESRSTHMLVRGDFLKPDKEVSPGVPGFLHPLRSAPNSTRLDFAEWLVSRESPTTARALVNRVWQAYFSTGLVATSEDFGRQSEAPSHPELLDWLAVEFMDRGWRLKELHRLIANSSTYRQSSRVSPDLLTRDPYNRLLARGPRFRVEGEIVRDIALAVSGLLNPKVGGPSVYPPAPEFLFQPPASYGPKNWHEEKGEDRYRRAIYTFRYRSVPYPMLQNFDAPNGDMSCVRRTRSNTPLQALTTLNEPLFLEAARSLALKTLQDGGANDQDRLRYAFQRVTARRPSKTEGDELLAMLGRQSARIAQGWVNAWEVAGYEPDHRPRLPDGVTPGQLAAWTAVSRVLLNLDETITKE